MQECFEASLARGMRGRIIREPRPVKKLKFISPRDLWIPSNSPVACTFVRRSFRVPLPRSCVNVIQKTVEGTYPHWKLRMSLVGLGLSWSQRLTPMGSGHPGNRGR